MQCIQVLILEAIKFHAGSKVGLMVQSHTGKKLRGSLVSQSTRRTAAERIMEFQPIDCYGALQN